MLRSPAIGAIWTVCCFVSPTFIASAGMRRFSKQVTKHGCLPIQAGVAPGRARLLRDRQKTIAYEAITLDFKGGNQRGADEITEAEDASAEDPDTIICEREKAL